MTDQELMDASDAAPCPISVEKTESGRIRLNWGTKDPLDFAVLSEKQAIELIDRLALLVNRRVEAGW